LEAKHAQAMAELEKKLKASNDKVQTLTSQLEAAKAEAKAIANIVFHKIFCYLDSVIPEISRGRRRKVTRIFRLATTLGFVRKANDGLTWTEAYEDVRNAINDVMSSSQKTIPIESEHQGYGYHDEHYVPCA
jgi:SMC interacting uncharacterized protein involved in chromosome segregation